MKGKKNMEHNLCKKEFYKLMLRDRLPVAEVQFPHAGRKCKIEFFSSPMGVILLANVGKNSDLREIKLYDRMGGGFVMPNLFCHDNLVCLDDGNFVSVSSRIQIEDVFDREFLIKIN